MTRYRLNAAGDAVAELLADAASAIMSADEPDVPTPARISIAKCILPACERCRRRREECVARPDIPTREERDPTPYGAILCGRCDENIRSFFPQYVRPALARRIRAAHRAAHLAGDDAQRIALYAEANLTRGNDDLEVR